MKEFYFKVDKKFNNYKTIDFLISKKISLVIINKIKFGNVYVNDKVIKNINDSVKTNDTVKIILPKDKFNPFITPIKGNLKILYEDDYLLAVNKDIGVTTHSSKYNKTLSLEQLVCGYFNPKPFTFRAINRLDKDTSGIILIAKDEYTASLLGEQMRANKIQKKYKALCVGIPKNKNFIIEKPILRENQNSIKRVCSLNGENAKTECRLIKTVGDNLSMLEVVLHTGKTHQIRVHLSSIGLPLYADSLYGEKVEGKTYSLEAYKISFTHPFTKKKIVLSTSKKV